MESMDAERRINPATLKELVEHATELRAPLTDAEWAKSVDGKNNVTARIHSLVIAIALPAIPQSHEFAVEYRLARAEAKSLHGACVHFERRMKRVRALNEDSSLSEAESKEVEDAGIDLFVALGRFIALAENL